MIKCPNCSAYNNLQKFCGNCGKPLLVDGVELQEKIQVIDTYANLEKRKKVGYLALFYFFRS